MDFVLAIGHQVMTYAGLAVASGVITSLLTQALKWKFILAPAKRYPRTVAGVLSAVVSLVAVSMLDMFVLNTAIDWVIFGLATFIVATQSYNIVHDEVKRRAEEDV